jgi:Ca2+-binding EF-hand superfamily protein
MPGSDLRRSHIIVLPMKRPGLTLAPPLAMLFLCTTLHAAESKAGDPNPPAMTTKVEPVTENTVPIGKMTAEQILQRFDKNHDGKLDEDERADAHEAMMQNQKERREKAGGVAKGEPGGQRLLELFDKNHDGRLDDEERAAAKKYAEEHGFGGGGANREEMLKRFDKNADGQLDEAERAEMQKAMPGMGGRGPAPLLMAMRQEITRRFDKNHDGKIDDEEWAELSPVLHERIENSLRQLQRYDKNADGTIDDQEWKAAAPEILRWLNEAPRPAGPEKAPAPKAEK